MKPGLRRRTWPSLETNCVKTMACPEYRIERPQPLPGGLLPPQNPDELYTDRSLGVAVAVKSLKDPSRERVRVVHIPTGEVVFQTAPDETGV